MGRRARKKRGKQPVASAPTKSPRQGGQRRIHFALLAMAITLVVALFWMSPKSNRTGGTDAVDHEVALVRYEREPQTLDDLLALEADELEQVDIARMNLLCATGMPGAENLDIEHALATLDRWAERVRFETERHLYRVHDPRYAEHYRNSEAYLRASFLLQVLQEDLGVKYDMTAVGNFSFADSRVAFIHGMIPEPGQTIADTKGGTCASLPVLYVAVGRRLGYPLKLVTTKGHIFCRWDGKDHPNPVWRERFNIEGSGEGFTSFDDEYYTRWPFRISQGEVRVARYLVSLTPAEEFAAFLAARGHCAFDNRQKGFAARCYENAYGYDPTRPSYSAWFLDAAQASNYWPHSPELNYRLVTAMNERNRNRRDPLAVSVSTPGFSGVNEVPLPSARPRLETGVPNPIEIESWQQPQPTVPAHQVPPAFQHLYQDQHLRHGSQP